MESEIEGLGRGRRELLEKNKKVIWILEIAMVLR